MGMKVGLRKSLRKRLMVRDGNLCHYCEVEMTEPSGDSKDTTAVTLEHIVPQSYGGGDDINNVVLACAECNGDRGNHLDFCWCVRCENVLVQFFDKKFFSIISANKYRIKRSPDGKWAVRCNRNYRKFKTYDDALDFYKKGGFDA